MKKKFIGIIILVSIAMVTWLLLSAFVFQNDFWTIDFSQWVTLLFSLILGFIVAYIFVEKNTRQRLLTDRLIAQMEKVKNAFEEDGKQIISSFHEENWTKKLLASTKKLNNDITLLKKYKEKLNAEEELNFIDREFIEYRTIVTECIDKLKKDDSLREKAILKINLIVNKFDEIILKQYN